MNLFIVGDVHGCLHTWAELLTYWNPRRELLVQVGDLIDRGADSPGVVAYARALQRKYNAVFLKGNHEFEAICHLRSGPNQNWLRQCGQITLEEYIRQDRDFARDCAWMEQLPVVWENDYIHISHAGVSATSQPYVEVNQQGVLWNRAPLVNLGRMQVLGHTPCRDGKPKYFPQANAWNIDTGAPLGRALTGMRVTGAEHVIETITIPTHLRDLPRKPRQNPAKAAKPDLLITRSARPSARR